MNVLDKYGLIFEKKKIENNSFCSCNCVDFGKYFFVSLVLNQLCDFELDAFIYDLKECIESKNNGNTGFSSDGVDNMVITYHYPYVEINAFLGENLIIHMENLKEILNEWKKFKQI